MDLSKDFNFVIIHIFRKMLVLLKNYLNYVKDNIFEGFLRNIINIFKNNLFFKTYNNGKFKS